MPTLQNQNNSCGGGVSPAFEANQTTHKKSNKLVALRLLFLILLLGISACGRENRTAEKLAKDTATLQNQNTETSLTFSDITLEQTDEQGRPLWKVKAGQAVYTKDKSVAQVVNPKGDLFQDGKVVYEITAQQGEVQNEGKKIFLKGQVVAVDIQNGAVLKGNELEWRPSEDVLIIRNQLTGTHKQLQVSAREARSFSRQKRMELVGQVVATAKEPPLHMKADQLVWLTEQQKVISDRPIQIDRYKGNITTITDRASGQLGEVDLKAKTAILKQNAQVITTEPPLQVGSNLMVWNLNNETIVSDQPVQMLHKQHQMTVSGDKGRVELKPKIAYLFGNVRGLDLQKQSKIFAEQMTWMLPTQVVEATGNVIYQQLNPPMNLTGPKAIGRLQDQTVTVSGGGEGNTRVAIEIIPEELEKR